MAFSTGSFGLEDAGQGRRRVVGRVGRSVMSDQQLQAYLVARDAVRRVRRLSALLPPGEWKQDSRPQARAHKVATSS